MMHPQIYYATNVTTLFVSGAGDSAGGPLQYLADDTVSRKWQTKPAVHSGWRTSTVVCLTCISAKLDMG